MPLTDRSCDGLLSCQVESCLDIAGSLAADRWDDDGVVPLEMFPCPDIYGSLAADVQYRTVQLVAVRIFLVLMLLTGRMMVHWPTKLACF